MMINYSEILERMTALSLSSLVSLPEDLRDGLNDSGEEGLPRWYRDGGGRAGSRRVRWSIY